jgi:hypothetical protein
MLRRSQVVVVVPFFQLAGAGATTDKQMGDMFANNGDKRGEAMEQHRIEKPESNDHPEM